MKTNTWAKTYVAGLTFTSSHPVWGGIHADLVPNGGMGSYEWVDLSTGAMILMVPEGTWETGGEYRLWWFNPANHHVLDITGMLSNLALEADSGSSRASRYYRSPADGGDSLVWLSIGGRLADLVDAELGFIRDLTEQADHNGRPVTGPEIRAQKRARI